MASISTSGLKASPYFTLKGAEVPSLRASCVGWREARRWRAQDTPPPGEPRRPEF